MNILAIRGANLASLAEPFVVDFAGPPLGHAGVFAITGPTGAGKSTLLDALCLALFDEMPRLPTGRAARLGRDDEPDESRVAANDVRSILRRGAVSGYAEVDFEGGDGQTYRARWEIRRARDRAGGKLQKTEMTLRRGDGDLIAAGKTEVLAETERRLGVTAKQFRRSVLLAQGDFANFLKAPPAERSAILELITGTEIYSRISVKAFDRAKEARLGLETLENQLAAVEPMTAAAREAAVADVVQAEQTIARGEAERETARRQVEWYRRLDVLVGEAAAADHLYDQAAAAVAGAAPRRAELAACVTVQPLRRLLADQDRTEAELSRAEAAQTEARGASQLAAEAVAARADEARTAAAAHDQAAAAQAVAAPDLARAADLDSRLAALGDEHTKAAAEHQRSSAVCRDLEAGRQRLDAALVALDDGLAGHAAWLAENAALAPVVEQWRRWDSLLERHEEATRALADAGIALATLDAERARLAERRPALERGRSEARDALETAAERLRALKAEARPTLAELAERRQGLEARRTALQSLTALVEEALRAGAAAAAAARDGAEHGDRHRREDAAAAVARDAAERTAAALGEAEDALRRVELARRQDVESLRARLEPGQACPVCGGAEHPWADHGAGAVLDQLGDRQAARVATLRRDQQAQISALAGHETAAREAASRRLEAEARGSEAASAVARSTRQWCAAAVAVPDLPGDPCDPAARLGLDAGLAEAESAVAAVLSDQAAAIAWNAGLDAAAEARHQAVEAANAAAAALAGLTERLDRLGAERALAEAASARAERDCDQVFEALAAPLAGLANWRDDLAGDTARFRAGLAVRVTAWQEREHTAARSRAERDELVANRRQAVAMAEGAAETEAAAGRRAAELAAALAQLAEQRAGVLDGRAVGLVRQELAARLEVAGRARLRATTAQQLAESRLAAAARDVSLRAEAAAERRAAADEARTALACELESRRLDRDELRRRLGHDQAWLDREQDSLARLDRAAGDAAVRAGERREMVLRHRAAGEPEHDAATAAAALEVAAAAVEAARVVLVGHQARLRADDDKRTQGAALREALAVQRQDSARWAIVNDLIGSADGKKFRNFAQSLSLDLLLGHANRQLTELARRYRLQRVQNSDLELQVVDLEMANDVRGVHSLSGGETFLVSLALALGLSAMAGGRIRFGTLFIDEGFGALDPDSLDIALSCLEALQAGGRRVGVISHIPALVERIGTQVRVTPCGGGRSTVAVARTHGGLSA